MVHEHTSMQNATQQVVHIIDTKYEKADHQSVGSTKCTHLSLQDQNKLLELLTEFEELFDGTLGDWNTEPVSFERKALRHIMAGHSRYQSHAKKQLSKN